MPAALKNKNRQAEKRLQERFSMHLPVKVSTDAGYGPELQYEP